MNQRFKDAFLVKKTRFSKQHPELSEEELHRMNLDDLHNQHIDIHPKSYSILFRFDFIPGPACLVFFECSSFCFGSTGEGCPRSTPVKQFSSFAK